MGAQVAAGTVSAAVVMSCSDLIWVGDHGHVVGRDLHGGGAHARGELPLGIGRDRLVAVGDQEPGRQRFPGRDAHHLSEGAPMQRLLDREHDLRGDRVDVGREVVDEVVLGQPSEALRVDVEMRQGGTRRSLLQQGADRFALVQPERGDVDQTNDVGRVGAERGDDLAAVGVPGNQGWPVLAGQDLTQPGDIIGQRGQRELGCSDAVPVGLQLLDNGAPTGAVGPGAVHEDDVGQRSHDGAPSSLRSTMTTG